MKSPSCVFHEDTACLGSHLSDTLGNKSGYVACTYGCIASEQTQVHRVTLHKSRGQLFVNPFAGYRMSLIVSLWLNSHQCIVI
jgi:hypothetical protein